MPYDFSLDSLNNNKLNNNQQANNNQSTEQNQQYNAQNDQYNQQLAEQTALVTIEETRIDMYMEGYEPARYEDMTSSIDRYKMDHGFSHSLHSYEKQRIEQAFEPYITVHFKDTEIKNLMKDLQQNHSGDYIYAQYIYTQIVDAYDSGRISKDEFKKWMEELIAAEPLVTSMYENGNVGYHETNRALQAGVMNKKKAIENFGEIWKNNGTVSQETIDFLANLDENKVLSEWTGYQFRHLSASALKFSGKGIKLLAKTGGTMAARYGMKLINSTMPFNNAGFTINDEATNGIKNLGSTGLRYVSTIGMGALSAMSMQVKAYAGLVRTTLTEKWASKFEKKYNEKQAKVDSIDDKKKRERAQNKLDKKKERAGAIRKARMEAGATDNEHPFKAVALKGLKQVGKSAGIGAVRGIAKSPKQLASFSTRQLSKMTTEAFGQTDSVLSSMWSTSRKTLRYGKKTVKAVAKAPKRIKNAVNTVKTVAKGVVQAGKLVVHVAQAAGQAIGTAVSALVSAGAPVIGIILGAMVAIVVVMVIVSSVMSCAPSFSDILASIFGVYEETALNIENEYVSHEDSISNAMSDIALEGAYDNGNEQWAEAGMEQDHIVRLVNYAKEHRFNYYTVSSNSVFNPDTQNYDVSFNESNSASELDADSMYHNPYCLIAYLTTLYGTPSEDDVQKEIYGDGLFSQQYEWYVSKPKEELVQEKSEAMDNMGSGNVYTTTSKWNFEVHIINHGMDATCRRLLAEKDGVYDEETGTITGESALLNSYLIKLYYYGNTDQIVEDYDEDGNPIGGYGLEGEAIPQGYWWDIKKYSTHDENMSLEDFLNEGINPSYSIDKHVNGGSAGVMPDYDDFDRLVDANSGYCWPVYDSVTGQPVLSFNTYYSNGQSHKGRDIPIGSSDPNYYYERFVVCAAWSGTVTYLQTDYSSYGGGAYYHYPDSGGHWINLNDGRIDTYGLMITITHDTDDNTASTISYGGSVSDRNGQMKTRYAHLDEVYVNLNDHVEKGEIIAAVGWTGNSSGPHLHFECIAPGGYRKDPILWLSSSSFGYSSDDYSVHYVE